MKKFFKTVNYMAMTLIGIAGMLGIVLFNDWWQRLLSLLCALLITIPAMSWWENYFDELFGND